MFETYQTKFWEIAVYMILKNSFSQEAQKSTGKIRKFLNNFWLCFFCEYLWNNK
jgi:hypothetical protein